MYCLKLALHIMFMKLIFLTWVATVPFIFTDVQVFHTTTPQCVYPFSCGWKFMLFPVFLFLLLL